jgi:hypothetical protein
MWVVCDVETVEGRKLFYNAIKHLVSLTLNNRQSYIIVIFYFHFSDAL